MVEIKDLQGGYGGQNVLQDVSMTARAGEITAILGPNGCGKSTLLKMLCGILPVSGGSIRLDDQDLMALPSQALAQQVAYLAQNRQVPDISVERLVLHGRFPYLHYPRRYRREDWLAAEQAMAQMGILEIRSHSLQKLSGGQRQKVYIAMALAQDTPVLLLDEPTTFLDISHQLQMLKMARTLAQSGKHVIMVIHDIPGAMAYAHQILLMEAGRVVMQDSPEGLYASGKLEAVFGVRVNRVEVEDGWQYFCR